MDVLVFQKQSKQLGVDSDILTPSYQQLTLSDLWTWMWSKILFNIRKSNKIWHLTAKKSLSGLLSPVAILSHLSPTCSWTEGILCFFNCTLNIMASAVRELYSYHLIRYFKWWNCTICTSVPHLLWQRSLQTLHSNMFI